MKKQNDSNLVNMPTAVRSVADEHCDLNSDAAIQMYLAHLQNNGGSTVTKIPAKGRTFREIAFENQRFKGYIGYDGPRIQKIVPKHKFWLGGDVQLGVAEIHYCDKFRSRDFFGEAKKAAWCICKYGPEEPRIRLDSISEKGLYTLAFQFGIPIYPHPKAHPSMAVPIEWTRPPILRLPDGKILFFLSPSFKDLCIWAKTHSRPIRSSEFKELYLHGWKDAAAKEDYLPSLWGWRGAAIKGACATKSNI